jgi:hypothetical protein
VRQAQKSASSVFTPVLAKHSKSFNLIDTLSVGMDRNQRNFEPLQRQASGDQLPTMPLIQGAEAFLAAIL